MLNDDDFREQQHHQKQNNSLNMNKNLISTKEFCLEGAFSTFQSMQNRTKFRCSDGEFVREIEPAFKDYLSFVGHIKALQQQQIENNRDDNSGVTTASNNNSRKAKKVGDELVSLSFPLYCFIFIHLFECGYLVNGEPMLNFGFIYSQKKKLQNLSLKICSV